jgi:hypothetical protein
MIEALKPALDTAWAKIGRPTAGPHEPPGVCWSWRLSPPFPSEWPLGQESRLVFYAYAEGFDINVMDGVRVAAPWALVEAPVSGGAMLVVTPLADSIRELGIQGVRPLRADEVGSCTAGTSDEEVFATVQASPEESEKARPGLSARYAFWSKYNGVIAEWIRSRNEAFFAWLRCA